MDKLYIDGNDYIQMINNGCNLLASDYERINNLNVFPVPDGDTGSNMKMTIEGGVKACKDVNNCHIGDVSNLVARGMVLNARGNSGVILSQFFKGLSLELKDYEKVDVKTFAKALQQATKKAYSVVQTPTEGTILTVMREAGDNAITQYNDGMQIDDYLAIYLDEANEALRKTPELLPVLKKAGVIDSGGAGFNLIIQGILKACKGEFVTANEEIHHEDMTINFNADSELTFGYCTEFILQLQNSKVNVKEFDIKVILDFLNSIGNSIVAFKDEDLVKVHVHTFDPGKVLTECRKYGEFITIKIENMNCEHNESIEIPEQERKEYAIITVASGDGIEKAFKEMGVDMVVSGGQTMNTSTQDFLDAFDRVNSDNIFVFPNNKNIILAANQAKELYKKSNVYIIPTKSIVEGYSAISMFEFDSNINSVMENLTEVISNVKTLEVTYAIRDCQFDEVTVKKGEFICLYDGKLLASHANKFDALKEAFQKIEDYDSKSVLTVICGKGEDEKEINELTKIAKEQNPYIEVFDIAGNQDIYSFIIGIE